MSFCKVFVVGVVVTVLLPLNSYAQSGQPQPAASKSAGQLTLTIAETTALAHQPQMLAAQLRARAFEQRTREARSGYFPTIGFNATGVRVADTGTSTAAGNLTTSSVSDRFAYGGNLTQLVTDFGRTSALVGSAHSAAKAQSDLATLTRAQVRLNVREAYFEVLGAEAVLRAARAAQDNRHLIARQLTALAQGQLRSTVDVGFAEVLASEADLAVVQAESVVAQQRARLATAMGETQSIRAPLAEVETPQALPPDPEFLLPGAQTLRADLSAAEARQQAAQQFATSEKRLSYQHSTCSGRLGSFLIMTAPCREITLPQASISVFRSSTVVSLRPDGQRQNSKRMPARRTCSSFISKSPSRCATVGIGLTRRIEALMSQRVSSLRAERLFDLRRLAMMLALAASSN